MIEDFFKIVANLKNIPRQGWMEKTGMSHPESVADHVFSTSMMAMVFGDLLKLDTQKLVKMALLHDLAESLTGDITPEKIPKDEKITLENKTMNDILLHLPNELRQNYCKIWQEFIKGNSIESKLLHQIDKLELALQAIIYSKRFNDKSFECFLDTADSIIQNPELRKSYDLLIKNNKKK